MGSGVALCPTPYYRCIQRMIDCVECGFAFSLGLSQLSVSHSMIVQLVVLKFSMRMSRDTSSNDYAVVNFRYATHVV